MLCFWDGLTIKLFFSYKSCTGSSITVFHCGHTFPSINGGECKHWNKSSGGDKPLHIEEKAIVQCFCNVMQHCMTYIQYRKQTDCRSSELHPPKANSHLQNSTSFNVTLGILILFWVLEVRCVSLKFGISIYLSKVRKSSRKQTKLTLNISISKCKPVPKPPQKSCQSLDHLGILELC